jgi:hypothetical protein
MTFDDYVDLAVRDGVAGRTVPAESLQHVQIEWHVPKQTRWDRAELYLLRVVLFGIIGLVLRGLWVASS